MARRSQLKESTTARLFGPKPVAEAGQEANLKMYLRTFLNFDIEHVISKCQKDSLVNSASNLLSIQRASIRRLQWRCLGKRHVRRLFLLTLYQFSG